MSRNAWRASVLLVVALLTGLAIVAGAQSAHAAPKSGGSDYLNYMAFGDSITYGVGTSDPATTSYPAQANVRGYGIGSSCIVAGDCDQPRYVVDWWPRYVDAMAHPPRVAVFMVGTNDYTQATPTQIENAMRRLQDLGSARGIRVVFGTITPAPAGSYWNIGGNGSGKVNRLAVNDWIRDHPRLRGPEYARALQCGAQDLCQQFVGPMGDVHVNDYAAATMGNVLRNWIEADHA